MKSIHSMRFNHDEDAATYDQDVLDSSHPLRAGYERCLDWIAEETRSDKNCSVVDLGCGTGNLCARIGEWKRLICVDVSGNMMAIAKNKLKQRNDVVFEKVDLLEFVSNAGTCDRIISSFAIHHLTDPEKGLLFERVLNMLNPHGRFVVGDLMFENTRTGVAFCSKLRETGRGPIADEIEDEFFWNLEDVLPVLNNLGFKVAVRSFSPVMWGLSATRID